MLVLILVLSDEGKAAKTQVRCIESERQALLRFKQGLEDLDDVLSSWTNSDEDCCSWRRIRCDNQTNHVIMLDLRAKFFYDSGVPRWPRLSGEINFALVELKHLEYLDLSFNDFQSIPKFIGSFRRLIYLNLSRNPFHGALPSQLQNLSKLQVLDISSVYYQMTGSLEWLSYLPSLRILKLSNINFTKDVDWLQSIKMAPSLTSLELWSCQFPEVDTWSLSPINSSNSLKTLDVHENMIHPKALPWLLNVSTNLVRLSLSDSNIGGRPLPSYFENLSPSLEYIELSWTGGGIPKSWRDFCDLKTLRLFTNDAPLHDLLGSLTGCAADSLEILDLKCSGGVIPDMKIFPSLKELYLPDNQLEGPFPNSLCQFSKLLVLNLENNLLAGPLPDLSQMSSLSELRLANNMLNNTLTESLGKLSNLKVLDLSLNAFTGVVSEVHFQKLSKLEELSLSFNSITLNISSNWLPYFQLATIQLSSCKLGPSFPRWLQNQRNLTLINLSNCSIADAIPNWFSNLTFKLQYLDLSTNHIHGTLPDFPLCSIRGFPGVIINLSSNKIRGVIPRFVFNATFLYLSNNTFSSGTSLCATLDVAATWGLDLSNNLLFGSLPDCWWKFQNLIELNLENNKLFGAIPRSLGSLERLQILRLSRNNFTGPLPSSLKNCTSLEYLDVGENNLNGKIPTWIGERLTFLVVLRIKSNKFYGTLPSNMCHLRWIRILDISLNHLSGLIPSCIYNFSSITNPNVSMGFTTYPRPQGLDLYAMLTWKGVDRQFGLNIQLLKMIDLSSNRLTGEIPKEMEYLVELVQLNLSRNNLSGAIPQKIGRLTKLDSLDLSHNQLSGRIPASMANMSFLDNLVLSYNNLSGRIPTGTQLQSFNASSYAGNPELCGEPLTTVCPGDESLDSGGDGESNAEDGGEWCDMSWFRMGIGVGFAVGFFGVCGNLLLITSWRLAYFQFLNNLGDWLYVRFVVNWAKLKRMFSIF
ncbi:hypothetical protein TIFTF001_037071 [Ficus carica]|uniref:Leucine-rich repeat-containing N-terminal plant-type domain-containing protein n=1 Tax=Ficus carica TaxID=3494 RepID=A0AA88E5L2_FICCA|nr:hypothetical protein TIFTF001_037071 [Ficus carica]